MALHNYTKLLTVIDDPSRTFISSVQERMLIQNLKFFEKVQKSKSYGYVVWTWTDRHGYDTHTDTRQILKVINVMSDISIHMSKCRCYIGHMWDTEMWSQYTLDQRRKSVQTDFFLWQKLYNINYDGNNISNILRREVKESSTWKNSSKSKENKEAKGQPNAWGSCHYEIQVW